MRPDRVWTASLLAAVAAVLLLFGWAAWLRWRPVPFAELLQTLRDGDVEHDERVALLRRLIAMDPVTDPAAPLCRVTAAIALDDEPALRAARGPAGTPVLGVADAPFLAQAGLGDPVLTPLLLAMAAELDGDDEAARARYGQVAASSRLFGMGLAGRLCQEGLARLP
ncbi:MAG: hypothetical protein AB7O97_14815 [Planctomycetota bacterium]